MEIRDTTLQRLLWGWGGIAVGIGVATAVTASGLILAGSGILLVAGGSFAIGFAVGRGEKGGGCFVEGTAVLMADMTQKPIERIAVGDVVLSRREKTGLMEGRRVTKLFVHDVASTLNVTLRDGQTIETTKEHRFALDNGRFISAELIDVGTNLCTDTSSIEVAGREVVDRNARVYNFAVEGFHTYFVGQNRVWVHNKKKNE